MKPEIYVILGATATGKTKIAIELAKTINGEIVSADSMQVYREMNIGTAKIMQNEMDGIKHHMIDVCNPDHSYSVAEYQEQALDCINNIIAKKKVPIIAGGSGLYINSLTFNLNFSATPGNMELRHVLEEKSNKELYKILEDKNPESTSRIHPNNRKRIIRALEIAAHGGEIAYNFNRQNENYNFKIYGLSYERPILYQRINERVDKMLSDGLEKEVLGLFDKYDCKSPAFQGIGYKEFISYFKKECDYNTAVDKIKQHSRNLAKRQQTWFKRDNRIRWFDLKKCDINNTKHILEQILG